MAFLKIIIYIALIDRPLLRVTAVRASRLRVSQDSGWAHGDMLRPGAERL